MNRQSQTDLNFLKSRPQQMSALLRTFKQATRELQAERRYLWPADYDRRMTRLRQEHRQAVDKLRAECVNARERLEAAAALSRGEAGRSDDPARAVNEQRAWARIRPLLERQPVGERIPRLQELIRDAGKRGDLATLRALHSELPLWLEVQEHPHEKSARQSSGKSFEQANGTLSRLMADLAQAGAPHLPPEERAAYEIEQQLARYDSAITGNLSYLEEAIADPERWGNIGLVGWEPGMYVRPDGAEVPSQPYGQYVDGSPASNAGTPPAPGSMHAFRAFDDQE